MVFSLFPSTPYTVAPIVVTTWRLAILCKGPGLNTDQPCWATELTQDGYKTEEGRPMNINLNSLKEGQVKCDGYTDISGAFFCKSR